MKKLLIIPMLFVCFMGMGQATAGGGKHFIGEKFGGGIVFNVSPDGLHGLISETQDQCIEINFYDVRKKNIIGDPKNHSAAGKSYTDWRLPTKEELKLLYLQRSVVGGFLNHYWSSTITNNMAIDAWYHNFNTGEQDFKEVGNRKNVRSIRAL